MNSESITLIQPDDWHVHLRDGEMLSVVLPYTACRFARAIIMPNLDPPIATLQLLRAYRQRILRALPAALSHFQPLMTLYLTESGALDSLHAREEIAAVKWYPAGATTGSQHGVRSIDRCYPTLERMEELGIPLLVHGEVTDPAVDVFDREAVFLEQEMAPLLRRFQALKVVLEHVTTQEGVDFVKAHHPQLGATITPHHLLLDRNAMFDGGLRPHHYCRPVLKRKKHQRALLEAATSGHRGFFLGTDTAPHLRSQKEKDCGCAGCFNAPGALEIYAHIFHQAGALDKLEGFASVHGANFHGLPVNTRTVTLHQTAWQMPATIQVGQDVVVPLLAGEKISWAMG